MKEIHTYRKDIYIYQNRDKLGHTYMSCAVFELVSSVFRAVEDPRFSAAMILLQAYMIVTPRKPVTVPENRTKYWQMNRHEESVNCSEETATFLRNPDKLKLLSDFKAIILNKKTDFTE